MATSDVTMLLTSRPLPMPGDESPDADAVVAVSLKKMRCCFRPYRPGLKKLEPPAQRLSGRRLESVVTGNVARMLRGPEDSRTCSRDLLEQLQNLLRQLVGLSHHRRRGLLQHLSARQVGCFSGKVGVLDAAA